MITLKENYNINNLINLGFDYFEQNEFNWFENYKKHIKPFTNIIIGMDRIVSIKYDDDFDHKWYSENEISAETEIQKLINCGVLELQ